MSRYAEVFWTPWFVNTGFDQDIRHPLEMLMQTPRSAISLLQEHRHGNEYLKCPAVTDALKNVFIVQAPFDLNVFYDAKLNRTSIDSLDQEFYDHFIHFRPRPRNHPPTMSIPPFVLFYSHDPVIAISQDVPIFSSEATRNTKHIIGQYDISKWIRPVDWSFELAFGNEVRIKRGDPLFSIKFQTKNNVPVKLTRIKVTKDLYETVSACVRIKKFKPNIKLKEVYEIAKDYLSFWRQGGGK